MPAFNLVRITTPDELRATAEAWDDLWLRSEVALPTVRAELVAQWIEQFAQRARFSALAVEGEGRLLAALPMVARVLKGCIPVASLTGNVWAPNGELLLDPHADKEAVLDVLAAGLDEAPWPLVWLDEVPFESPRWQGLLSAVRRRGMEACERFSYQVGQVETPVDWSEYEARWSRNHRQKMRKVQARLEREGPATWTQHVGAAPDEVEELLRRAFEVEDRSWKGASGTSVLRTPGMFEFYCGQARRLAERGELEVDFLELGGEDIAFNYGFRAKGTSFAFKVGYDERFAAFSPGLAMVHHLLKSFQAAGQPAVLDFCGPLQDWTSKWATRTYPVGRVVIAPRRPLSRLLLRAYSSWWPAVKKAGERLRRRAREEQPPAEEALADIVARG